MVGGARGALAVTISLILNSRHVKKRLCRADGRRVYAYTAYRPIYNLRSGSQERGGGWAPYESRLPCCVAFWFCCVPAAASLVERRRAAPRVASSESRVLSCHSVCSTYTDTLPASRPPSKLLYDLPHPPQSHSQPCSDYGRIPHSTPLLRNSRFPIRRVSYPAFPFLRVVQRLQSVDESPSVPGCAEGVGA